MKLLLYATIFAAILACAVTIYSQSETPGSIKVITCRNCEGILITLPNPEYPSYVGYGPHKYTGEVGVQIVIDGKGNVESAKAIFGHPYFRRMLENASLKAKFRLPAHDGLLKKLTGILVYKITPSTREIKKQAKSKLGIVNGRATYLPKPQYSQKLKDLCAYGQVEIEILISEDGNIIEAKPISGNELLHESAVEAVKKAKFATMYEIPFKTRGIVIYNFLPEKKCFDAGIVNKKAKFIPRPEFPKSCRCAGKVVVQVIIDILEGKVVLAKVISGHPLLGVAALKSAQNAIFAPTFMAANWRIRTKGILIYNFSSSGKIDF